MSEFDLCISRLYACLIGMDAADAKFYGAAAATLQAMHANTQRALRVYADAR